MSAISIKLGKKEVTFNLSFDKYQWRVSDSETHGIVMDGYFDNQKSWSNGSVQSIKYFSEELRQKADKEFKKAKLIK